MDGLKAINVYVITTDDGLVLIDGGWSIPVARDLLDRCLRDIGAGFGDIRRFLVTHIHRDHYTLARVLANELGVDVALGRGEERAMVALNDLDAITENPFAQLLRTAGAHDIAEIWNAGRARTASCRIPSGGRSPTPGSTATTRSRCRRRADPRRGRDTGPHARALRLRRPGRRAALRRRPRAADDHPVDRVHRSRPSRSRSATSWPR